MPLIWEYFFKHPKLKNKVQSKSVNPGLSPINCRSSFAFELSALGNLHGFVCLHDQESYLINYIYTIKILSIRQRYYIDSFFGKYIFQDLTNSCPNIHQTRRCPANSHKKGALQFILNYIPLYQHLVNSSKYRLLIV